MSLKTTLPEPPRPHFLPKNAQWLAGEGAGSWFHIDKQDENYLISRFSPEGKLECKSLFEVTQKDFDIAADFDFVHLSHCAEVNIQQKNKVFTFKRKT